MVVNKKVTGTASSIPAGVAIGCTISVLIAVVAAGAFAKLIDAGVMGETTIGYCAMVILLISSFAGAWTAAAKIKHRKALCCLTCGAVYYGILLGMTALIFGGQYQGMGVTALLIGAGSVCAMMLEFPKGKGRTGRKRKIGYR